MVIDPTAPRFHFPEALATWWRMFLLTGSLFGVLFSAAMAAVVGESFLEYFWPLGAVCGVLAGAMMGFFLLMEVPPASVTVPFPLSDEALETLTQEAQNCRYVLASSTPASTLFLPRRTLFGFTVQPLRVESAGEGGFHIIGPKSLVKQIGSAAAERLAGRRALDRR